MGLNDRRGLIDAALVRAKAPTDCRRRRIEPAAVAVLDDAWGFDAAEKRNHPFVEGSMEIGLCSLERLARPEDDHTLWKHERRVVRERGIGEAAGVVRRGANDCGRRLR